MVVMFLGLLAFAAGQSSIPDCGKLGQRCCRLADYEVDDRQLFGKLEEQNKTDKFRYCADEYYEDLACDIETDKCIDEDTLDCGREGERCCNLQDDVAGDYPSMLVCLDFELSFLGYARLDLYCDFTDNKCKQFWDLPCGAPGKACCSPATLGSSEDYQRLGRYNIYNPSCSKSWCTNGVCEECNKVGDKCCDTGTAGPSTEPFCMDMQCVDGTCKECGGEGQQCCDADSKITVWSDYFNYDAPPCNEKKFVCSNGRCVASEGGCYGSACSSNEVCDDFNFTNFTCIQCGVDGTPCCADSTCLQDDLTCWLGTCECGGYEQKCCNSGRECDDNQFECREGLCQERGQEAFCGEMGKECCDGGLCVKNAFCNERQNVCKACGKNKQKCCPGKKCANARLTCNSDGRCVRD